MKHPWILCVTFLLLSGHARPGHPDEIRFPLARDGHAVAEIVVAGSNELVEAAVEDLVAYTRKSTGAELAVYHQEEDRPGPTLHVGRTAHATDLEAALEAVKVDGFIMAAAGEDLILLGAVPAGTGNGVLDIVQDHLGVRWYYPGELWEVVPAANDAEIRLRANHGKGVYLENPSYLGRHIWGAWPDPEFARRVRATMKGVDLPYVGCTHSISRVVEPEEYFDSHPEYFALVDGERTADSVCFTHPDMPKLFMAYVRAGNSSLGTNDNLACCRCDRCAAVDGKATEYHEMPTVSESYFQLIREVASRTAGEMPGHQLGLFAYQTTSVPPETVDYLGDNVSLILCQDTSQHFDRDYRNLDYRYSKIWAEKASKIRFYDYYGIGYWMPRYMPTLLVDQLKYCADLGVMGYGTHAGTMPDTSMPMFYLYYRLLWDARLDDEAALEEMFGDLYGEAARPMRAFYDHWEECWMRPRKPKWFYGMDDVMGELRLYTEEDIERGREFLDEALELARDGRVRSRIEWVGDRFRFTESTARFYFAAERAKAFSGRTVEDAVAASDEVRDAWASLVDALEDMNRRPDNPVSGWLPRNTRVRCWGLKQLARDAVVMPGLIWVAEHEPEVSADEMQGAEERLRSAVAENRREVEERLTEMIEAPVRDVWTAGFPAGAIPSVKTMPDEDGWSALPAIAVADWVYKERPDHNTLGKYTDWVRRFVVDAPEPDDHEVTWRAAYDWHSLYLAVDVTDDVHVSFPEELEVGAFWVPPGDGLRVALDPGRTNADYPEHSWGYMWGGFLGDELVFDVALDSHGPRLVAVQTPEGVAASLDELVEVKISRDGNVTRYRLAVDWRALGISPAPRKSIGVSLLVSEAEETPTVYAEYGGGLLQDKRSIEYAALRLGE
jgi:hypothetical protein